MLRRGKLHLQAASALSLGLCLVLSSCGGGGDRPSSQEGDLTSYIEQSCQYKATDGGSARPRVSSNPIVTGYFDKSYNQDWLKSVGHSSILHTIEYVEGTGAQVYRADPKTAASCKNFASLSAMPPAVATQWKLAERSADDQNRRNGTTGFVAGLYLPEYESIIIRADASRWTLVHEFMHHNFKQLALQDGEDSIQTQKQRVSLADQMGKILSSDSLSDRQKVQQVTPLFMTFVDASDRFLVEYPLEEVAVEATLQDQVDSKDMDFVPTKSYANATWYIERSRKMMNDFYQEMDNLYFNLRQKAAGVNLWTEYNQMGQYLDTKAKRVDQIDAVIHRHDVAKSIAKASDASALSTPAMGVPPCAEAAAADEMMEELRARIARISKP